MHKYSEQLKNNVSKISKYHVYLHKILNTVPYADFFKDYFYITDVNVTSITTIINERGIK